MINSTPRGWHIYVTTEKGTFCANYFGFTRKAEAEHYAEQFRQNKETIKVEVVKK